MRRETSSLELCMSSLELETLSLELEGSGLERKTQSFKLEASDLELGMSSVGLMGFYIYHNKSNLNCLIHLFCCDDAD